MNLGVLKWLCIIEMPSSWLSLNVLAASSNVASGVVHVNNFLEDVTLCLRSIRTILNTKTTVLISQHGLISDNVRLLEVFLFSLLI